MEVKNPIVIFGEYLRYTRESTGYSIKSAAYQLGLSNFEYIQLEEGLEIKYMTSLRSCVAIYLLHINEIPDKKEKFQSLYREAVDYQGKLDDELVSAYKATLFPEEISSNIPERSMPVVPDSHTEMDQIMNEMDGI